MASTDSILLKLSVSKNLIDEGLAKEVFEQGQREGRSVVDVLLERGVLTRHIADNLLKEVERVQQPSIIGGFQVIAKIGQGGMGAVYRATQLSMQREVALKVISPKHASDQDAADRFIREARAAGSINHPNVVSCYDAGRDGKILYLAMELVTGGDADKALKAAGGRLPLRRAVEIIRDACLGLEAIHRTGLLHRDIKPSNIFLTAEGAGKLADLGLARSASGDDKMTVSGVTVGTPAYMSPEQADGQDVDIRTDIYALGATLFTLITGQPPFRGNTPWATVASVIKDPFPDPQDIVVGLPPEVSILILRACAKSPDSRFRQPAAMTVELNRLLAGTTVDDHALRPRTPGAIAAPRAADFSDPIARTTPRTVPKRPAQRQVTQNKIVIGSMVGAVLLGVITIVMVSGRRTGDVVPPQRTVDSSAPETGASQSHTGQPSTESMLAELERSLREHPEQAQSIANAAERQRDSLAPREVALRNRAESVVREALAVADTRRPKLPAAVQAPQEAGLATEPTVSVPGPAVAHTEPPGSDVNSRITSLILKERFQQALAEAEKLPTPDERQRVIAKREARRTELEVSSRTRSELAVVQSELQAALDGTWGMPGDREWARGLIDQATTRLAGVASPPSGQVSRPVKPPRPSKAGEAKFCEVTVVWPKGSKPLLEPGGVPRIKDLPWPWPSGEAIHAPMADPKKGKRLAIELSLPGVSADGGATIVVHPGKAERTQLSVCWSNGTTTVGQQTVELNDLRWQAIAIAATGTADLGQAQLRLRVEDVRDVGESRPFLVAGASTRSTGAPTPADHPPALPLLLPPAFDCAKGWTTFRTSLRGLAGGQVGKMIDDRQFAFAKAKVLLPQAKDRLTVLRKELAALRKVDSLPNGNPDDLPSSHADFASPIAGWPADGMGDLAEHPVLAFGWRAEVWGNNSDLGRRLDNLLGKMLTADKRMRRPAVVPVMVLGEVGFASADERTEIDRFWLDQALRLAGLGVPVIDLRQAQSADGAEQIEARAAMLLTDGLRQLDWLVKL